MTQHTGQAELHYSDNFMTAHQAVGKPTQAVHCVRKWPAAISHGPAETPLRGELNDNGVGEEYIYRYFSTYFLTGGCLPYGYASHTWKNCKQKQLQKATDHSCHSYFQSPAGCGPLLTPSFTLSLNAFGFLF